MSLNDISQIRGPGIHSESHIVSEDITLSGIATASNFKTGTSNVHNVGIEIAGINVLGADTPIRCSCICWCCYSIYLQWSDCRRSRCK